MEKLGRLYEKFGVGYTLSRVMQDGLHVDDDLAEDIPGCTLDRSNNTVFPKHFRLTFTMLVRIHHRHSGIAPSMYPTHSNALN